jgi:hypothetical protein
MARSEGLEPPAYKFVACCSIQLSYDRTAASGTSRFLFSPPSQCNHNVAEREGFEPSDGF